MKRVLLIIILLIALAFQSAQSQQESGWIDKGNYLENKFVTYKYTTYQYNFVQFSPNGKTILTYGDDQFLRKWDAETGTLLKEIKMTDHWFIMYDISSDNKYFAFYDLQFNFDGYNDTLYIYDIENEEIKCTPGFFEDASPWISNYQFLFVKFHPVINNVVLTTRAAYNYGAGSSGIHGFNIEYSADTCNGIQYISRLVPKKLEYSPDGKKYAISGYSESRYEDDFNYKYQYIHYYKFELHNDDIPDKTFILDSMSSDYEYIEPLTPYFLFTPDSKYLAVFGGNKIKFWDVITGEHSMTIDNISFRSYINYSIIFSKDMKYLIIWENNNNNLNIHFIHIKDTETSDPIIINNVIATCLDLSNDSSFVIGTSDGRLLLIKNIYSNIIKKSITSGIKLIYPNPANDLVRINYSLSENSWVKLTLFDFMGKEIRTLIDENKTANDYVETINTGFMTEGMYFLKLQTGTTTSLFKLMINR